MLLMTDDVEVKLCCECTMEMWGGGGGQGDIGGKGRRGLLFE